MPPKEDQERDVPYITRPGVEPSNCTKGNSIKAPADAYGAARAYIKTNPASNCCTIDSSGHVTQWQLPRNVAAQFRSADDSGITSYYHTDLPVEK